MDIPLLSSTSIVRDEERVVEFDRFNVRVVPNPRVVKEDGCSVIHPDDCDLPRDIWEAMPRPRDETMTIAQAPVKDKTTGGVLVPPAQRAMAAQVSYLGLVLAMGDACYRREKFMALEPVEAEDGTVTYRRRLLAPACKIGDTVIFGRQTGLLLPVHPRHASKSNETVDFRFLVCGAVNGVAPEPDRMQQCAAFGL